MIKKFLQFLDKSYQGFRYKVSIFIAFSIFGSLLEVMSIGLLIPLLQWITSPNRDLIVGNLDVSNYINLNSNELFYIFIIFIILIFFIKFIFLIGFEIYKNNFLLHLNQNISKNMFISYIYRNYDFFSKHNSAEIINNIRGVDEYCNGVFSSILKASIDLLTLLFFLIFLLIFNVKVTLGVLSILLILCIIIYFFTRKSLKKKGAERFLISQDLYKFLGETFRGIREVKIYSLQDKYISLFNNSNFKHYSNAMTISLINFCPKILVEFLVVVGFLFSLFFLLEADIAPEKILVFFGVALLVLLRVMPILLRILQNFQVIKSRFYAFEKLNNNLFLNTNQKGRKFQNENGDFKNLSNKICGRNIFFSYDDKNTVFEDLNFEFKIGEIIGISGHSGCGKSTLVDLLSGLIKPQNGQVIADQNYNINKHNDSWLKNIAYISQNTFIFDGTFLDNIVLDFERKEYDIKKIHEIVEVLDLSEIINNLPNGMNSNIGESGMKLSGGQRQRIGIARALYKSAPVLIFDESTSGLDLNSEEKILKNVIKLKQQKIIIMISHRKETLSYCDLNYKIDQKRLVKIK